MKIRAVNRALRSVALLVAPTVGAGLIRALGASTRVHLEGLKQYQTNMPVSEPTLFSFWHDQLLAMIVLLIARRVPYAVLISQHPDAEPIARAVSKLGLEVVRGSSSHGGLKALGELARRLRGGGNVVFTPDGPRGPRHRVSKGTVILAQRAGVRIVPTACASRPRLRAGSWDRLQIPLPFARGVVLAGKALRVPINASAAQRENIRRQLERSLTELTARAEAMIGRAPNRGAASGSGRA